MKKLTVLFAVILITVSTNAQIGYSESPKFKYGFKAGINLASLSAIKVEALGMGIDLLPGSKMSAGFFAAAHCNFSFTEFIGIQPEVMFSMQGGKINEFSIDLDDMEMSLEDAITFRYNYINVPVLFDIKPFKDFSILVGPQIGFNMSKSISTMGESMPNEVFDVLKEFGIKFNTIDFSLVFGAQYAVAGRFIISARYNLGISNVWSGKIDVPDDIGGGIIDIPNIGISGSKNRVIQIGIGYQF